MKLLTLHFIAIDFWLELQMSEGDARRESPGPRAEECGRAGGAEPLEDDAKASEAPTASNTSGLAAESEHVTYDESGTAIYTDPSTQVKYKFSAEKNQWLSLDGNEPAPDPYENEHYRWCHETNQWIPKQSAASATENEYYRWDAERLQWIPKMSASGTVSEFKDGVHTYTDTDGVVFFWDTEKNAWFPKIDDDFMAIYQLNYGFVDNTGGGGESAAKQADELKSTEASSQAKAAAAAAAAAEAKGVKRKPQEPRK